MSTTKRVIALGFFDGVHRGHGALLRAVNAAADRLEARPCAFTFDRSPTAVITGQPVPLLSSVEDRIWLMRRYYGIQEVIVASFDGMQKMDWQDFITEYLIKQLVGQFVSLVFYLVNDLCTLRVIETFNEIFCYEGIFVFNVKNGALEGIKFELFCIFIQIDECQIDMPLLDERVDFLLGLSGLSAISQHVYMAFGFYPIRLILTSLS